mmetsp:Transcript_25978/g.60721  ORF Transcript_25978/g.60721 Transcript_25978/m.60721 type:complete len:384 (+) Transcript_25978:113-1264(+)|eukprot:CAMPEP_0178413028 /NCGR_PEP_ID=MMETSP0689_2-20121128/22319_1 /TAXON_ID=160604 /ORGANISM="Amphidinium massartii, Strain CS-259" /LENGTH=383 /DNA_ID=CAMNT_0020034293 /DNA_START=41 /DNA_END=1192 /DNA_ORIENTATION=+
MVLGGDGFTSFSYFDYQVLQLILAGMICVCVAGLELIINRFQALPVLFPGMFSVRDRRFYVYEADISDGSAGKKIRAQAKLLTRMTVCILLSYLWQNCVLVTEQVIGKGFPHEQCGEKFDCFASELHFLTLLNRQYTEVDCSSTAAHEDFEDRVVITCMKFVNPQATSWLMHLAIAHSVGQLHIKCFELLVWIAGKSAMMRRLLAAGMLVSLFTFIVLFFAGALKDFITSWLSFVMAMSLPTFLYTVWRSGQALTVVWLEQDKQLQQSIELHLSAAFRDIESVVDIAQRDPDDAPDRGVQARKSRGMHRRVISTGVDRIISGIRAWRDKTGVSASLDAFTSTGPPSGASSRVASTADLGARQESSPDNPVDEPKEATEIEVEA